jgi:amino acid transporter
MFGVGATIGTGIFFVLSSAVPEAGPAVIVSFVMAGVAAGLAAICYARDGLVGAGVGQHLLLRLRDAR